MTRGGLERRQRQAHNLHQVGSTLTRATTRGELLRAVVCLLALLGWGLAAWLVVPQ